MAARQDAMQLRPLDLEGVDFASFCAVAIISRCDDGLDAEESVRVSEVQRLAN
jgi:hypothetical protein